MNFKVSELAKLIGGTAVGDDVDITGLKSLEDAGEGDVTLLFSKKKVDKAIASGASCFIVPEKENISIGKPVIVVKEGKPALAKLIDIFYPQEKLEACISTTAVVHPSVYMGEGVVIEDKVVVGKNAHICSGVRIMPGTYVGDGAYVGRDTLIYPNVTIYENCRIGADCIIHSGTVIGSDGYGYYSDAEGHHKVRHVGNVVIGDRVELGSNCTIDRGTLSATVIGDGTKFDNQIHLGHNCVIGKDCLIMAMAAFSGSTTLGDNVVVGGLSAFADHLTIASGTMIAGHTTVPSNIDKKGIYAGEFASPRNEYMRNQLAFRHLADMKRKLDKLVKRHEKNDETD